MYKGSRPIATGVGIAAVVTATLIVATHASGDSVRTYNGSGSAGDTVTMTVDPTTLETASFAPVTKAEVPCGFAAAGGC
jgi:hypothetical protein